MTFDQDAHRQGVREDSAPFKRTLFLQSRETGEIAPPPGSDGVSVAEKASPFGKSWAHFIAGG